MREQSHCTAEVAAPRRGRPRVAHSLLDRVRQFYIDNPTEELTHAQLATKFGCTLKQANYATQYLAGVGLLESVHIVRRPQMGRAS